MKVISTLLLLFIGILTLPAQNITGIWRGYFTSSNAMYREGTPSEMYKYEVQILQSANTSIRGVTFSYKTTIFYGKASAQGIYNVKSKTLLLKETALLDLKIGDKSEPCLMTCYLDYSKVGKLEVLQGTFISVNIKDKGDCGSGTVYLEKVPTSDFKKEDFLIKKTDTLKKTTKPATVTPPVVKKQTTPAITQSKPKVTQKSKPPIQSPTTPPPSTPKQAPPKEEKTEQVQKPVAVEPVIPERKKIPVPKVLRERENNLVKTIITDQEYVQVDIFDNGTIDNDTITVYHNNELIIKNGKLNITPLSFKIKNSPTDNLHELIIVAENLGDIPPNTALMVITAGKKRYEIFLASNETKNAKVIIEYKQ
jgi:hypothetical protein